MKDKKPRKYSEEVGGLAIGTEFYYRAKGNIKWNSTLLTKWHIDSWLSFYDIEFHIPFIENLRTSRNGKKMFELYGEEI